MKNIIKGGMDLINGGRILLTTRKLWPFVWVPLFINAAVYSVVFGLGIYYFNDLLTYIIPSTTAWYMEVLRVFIWVAFAAVVLIIMFFTFFAIASVIASPFNEKLSIRYEELVSNRRVQDDMPLTRVLTQEIKRVLVYLAAFIVLGLFSYALSFVPMLNLTVPFIWALFSALVLSFEFLCYALDRRGLTFDQKIEFIKKNFSRCSGFGVTVYLALMLPVISIAVIPCAVIGATHMCLAVPSFADMTDAENILPSSNAISQD